MVHKIQISWNPRQIQDKRPNNQTTAYSIVDKPEQKGGFLALLISRRSQKIEY